MRATILIVNLNAKVGAEQMAEPKKLNLIYSQTRTASGNGCQCFRVLKLQLNAFYFVCRLILIQTMRKYLFHIN